VGDLLDALGARGFGPLMVTFSAFLLTPVGAVPGVPAIVALLLMLLGVQMLIPLRHLWLPGRLRRVSFRGEALRRSIGRARPAAKRLHLALAPRLSFLVEGPVMLRMIALILIATGGVVLLAGFIPFLPYLLSLHVLFLGLALTARDGLVGLLGFAAVMPEVILAWYFLL